MDSSPADDVLLTGSLARTDQERLSLLERLNKHDQNFLAKLVRW